jgi:hypothetical protein
LAVPPRPRKHLESTAAAAAKRTPCSGDEWALFSLHAANSDETHSTIDVHVHVDLPSQQDAQPQVPWRPIVGGAKRQSTLPVDKRGSAKCRGRSGYSLCLQDSHCLAFESVDGRRGQRNHTITTSAPPQRPAVTLCVLLISRDRCCSGTASVRANTPPNGREATSIPSFIRPPCPSRRPRSPSPTSRRPRLPPRHPRNCRGSSRGAP